MATASVATAPRVKLAHMPGKVVCWAVPQAPGDMQVCMDVDVALVRFSIFLPADEARAVAASLVNAAEQHESAQRAEVVA